MGSSAVPISAADGYDSWAPYYDEPGNGLIDAEQPIVWDILNCVPIGTAVDAACGTGRHAAHLAELHQMPLSDDHADVVVCALALIHIHDLAAALAEFARVVKPGGRLVISDSRGLMPVARRYPVVKAGPDGRPGYLPNWIHQTGDYLRVALPLGFQVRRCAEPIRSGDLVDKAGASSGPGLPAYAPSDVPPNIWTLHPFAPTATNAAYRDVAHLIVWHFQLAA